MKKPSTETDFDAIGQQMHNWASELWALPRSITGPGTRATLEFFKAQHPTLKYERFVTGEKVLDWTIPKVWTIRDSYLEHESGQRFAEFKESNLHVLGYSAPLDVKLPLGELNDLIYTDPDQPEWVPYVTSYYKERSGFCMSHRDRLSMPDGEYRAFIDSQLDPGELIVGDLHLPGLVNDEILFSTYICHPSMANNELSGPVLASALAQYIRQSYPSPRYSYRFLFLVETIGSIAYISRFLDRLQQTVAAGFVLSCVGDERAYSHVQSRAAQCLADRAIQAALLGEEKLEVYPFLTRGSDERQFCAPGVDLPVCGFCRSKYAQYPEYHTSADDLTLVTPAGLQGSFDVMASIIDAFELGLMPKATVLCEPNLGKRNLYPTISMKGSYGGISLRRDCLAYADGKTDIFALCAAIGQPLSAVVTEMTLLVQHGLIEFV